MDWFATVIAIATRWTGFECEKVRLHVTSSLSRQQLRNAPFVLGLFRLSAAVDRPKLVP